MVDKDRHEFIDPEARNRHKKYRGLFMVVGVVLLSTGIAAIVYYWQQVKISELHTTHQTEVTTLNNTIEALKVEVADVDSRNSDDYEGRESYDVVRSVVTGAVEGGTYTELSTRMTNPVNVFLVKGDGLGSRSPAQAVEDLKYINNSNGSWLFDVPTETLIEWRSGEFGEYIPENGVIARSSDGYVVTFKLNVENEITDIFMASNENEL